MVDPSTAVTRSRIALHQRIYAQLRKEIASSFRAGDVLPSQNELAKRFKVSFLTIREALSILAEEGVIDRRRGKDTIVVDPAGGQHVAVVLELDVADPRTSHHFRIATQRARAWFRAQGYPVRQYIGVANPGQENEHLFNNHGTTCPELIEDVDSGRIRGVVVIGGPTTDLARYLAGHAIPVVGDATTVRHRVTCYSPEQFVRTGIDYLLARGRRKLAFMTWGQPSAIIHYARAHNLELNMQWLRCDLPPAAAGSGWEEFREIWTASRERPDGILITDDMLFEDALHAMIESKVSVPDDLLVVTHASKGAPPWAPFPVTRIEADPYAFAENAGQLLVDLMNRDTTVPAEKVINLNCTLIEPATATGAATDSADRDPSRLDV